ncbi:glycosyltransferase family 4 protein [PVC group bacterium]|nr:glycosyltransferase family 4 protein [PVC group bacterium]
MSAISGHNKKIKVAHVITRMIIGGAQENTLYTVQGLAKMPQYDVDLISGPTYGPEGALTSQHPDHDYDVKIIPSLKRNLNPFLDIIAFFHLFITFMKGRYHIVHTHSAKAGILGRLAAKCAGVPIIVHTIHGLSFHPYQENWLNYIYIKLEKIVAFWTSKLIVVCDRMCVQSVKVGIAPKNKYVKIYSGIDVEDFYRIRIPQEELLRQLNIEPDKVIIGKVARLFPLKGHIYLLKAVRSLIRDFPNLRLVLVGDGILKEHLMRESVRYGIQEYVRFVGLVPPEEISSYLSIMNIVVHVSLREGLARVIPQAMLLKKPVVAFNLDGAPELIFDGKTGCLVKPESLTGLNSALAYLLKNPSQAKHMGSMAKDMVEPKFSHLTMVKKIDDVYNDLIKEEKI